jgi:hypothetical protein
MTNEEMNQKMEFIIEHQAKFTADIEIIREIQAADAKLFREQDRRLSNAFIGLVEIVGNLTQAQTNADVRINLLTEAQTRTEDNIKRLIERLNIFVNVVERYISGNGGSGNHA